MNKEIKIPQNWFKTLAKLAEQAHKDQDEFYKSSKEFIPTSISMLIAYASSAKTILKYNKNTKVQD